MYLVMGIPNAGKTTYSQQFANVIHADDYIGNHDEYRKLLETVDSECIEGLYTTRKSRLLLLSECPNAERRVCVFIDTPPDVCMAREGEHNCSIPYHARRLEPPTYGEGWDEIWVVRGNERHRLERQAEEEPCNTSYPTNSTTYSNGSG